MKISFPYMGCVTGYKKLLEMLGHEVIMPPKPTKKTSELGAKYSPEFICYPFKIMLGTYFEAVEMGAEVIVSSGGTGPCRAGYYSEIHEKILKQEGHDVPVIVFDSIYQRPKEFFKKAKLIANKTHIHKIIYAGIFTLKLIFYMDMLEKEMKRLRAYEIEKGSANKVWSEIVSLFDLCKTLKDLKSAKNKSLNMLKNIPIKNISDDKKIRVGIIGEIYVAMESSTNMDVEQRLNDMGVEVENVQYISDFLIHQTIPKEVNKAKSHKILKKAKKYIKVNCGAHDQENVGWIIDFAERGFDAVIHLMPFSCLPELVTRSVLPALTKDYKIPVLSISLDEQTGSANLQTRIEALIDLVRNKKKLENKISDVKIEKKLENLYKDEVLIMKG